MAMTPLVPYLEGYDVVENLDEGNRYVIDLAKKEIAFDKDKLVVISGENKSNAISFRCNKELNGIDLSGKKIRIMYNAPSGLNGHSDPVNVYVAAFDDGTGEEAADQIFFTWLIPEQAVTPEGKLRFSVQFADANYRLKIKTVEEDVEEGLGNADEFDPPEEAAKWYEEILVKCEALVADADNSVEGMKVIEESVRTYAEQAGSYADEARVSCEEAKAASNKVAEFEGLPERIDEIDHRFSIGKVVDSAWMMAGGITQEVTKSIDPDTGKITYITKDSVDYLTKGSEKKPVFFNDGVPSECGFSIVKGEAELPAEGWSTGSASSYAYNIEDEGITSDDAVVVVNFDHSGLSGSSLAAAYYFESKVKVREVRGSQRSFKIESNELPPSPMKIRYVVII